MSESEKDYLLMKDIFEHISSIVNANDLDRNHAMSLIASVFVDISIQAGFSKPDFSSFLDAMKIEYNSALSKRYEMDQR